MKVVDIEVSRCEEYGSGGFCTLRRCKVRNVRADGTLSDAYQVDAVRRPSGTDAVAVLAYQPGPEPRVLLRRGLRPALRLAHSGDSSEHLSNPVLHVEAVAGIVEWDDVGSAGLRQRAAAELWEEAGLRVRPERVQPLGPAVYLSPGLMAERIHYCRVVAQLDQRATRPVGDGSVMEEGGEVLVLPLVQALAMCASGEIQDAKTELGLMRLQAQLSSADGSPLTAVRAIGERR